jgi:hypothetical protein
VSTPYCLLLTVYCLLAVYGQSYPFREQDSLIHPGLIKKKLAGGAFGCLQGIDLHLFGGRGLSQVSSHAAFPGSPFDSRLRENKAILAGGELFDFLAAVALLNDGMAVPSVELTAILAHEKTLNTRLYAIANHGYHIPSLK